MNKTRTSPYLLLWLLAAATVLILSLWQIIETRISAQLQQLADETLLAEILGNVEYANELLMDTFVLDPADNNFAQTELLGLTASNTAYIARQQGRIAAFVLPAETLEGYNGSIRLLIGVTVEGEISGVRVVAHNETPRLGDKITLAVSDWVLNFNNRSLDNTDPRLWRVKKEGGEFDQFAGATITPRAVVDAVRDALEFFATNREALLAVSGSELTALEQRSPLLASTGITTLLAALMQPLPLFVFALLLALKNFLAAKHYPSSTPPTTPAAGSKRVRVTGKS